MSVNSAAAPPARRTHPARALLQLTWLLVMVTLPIALWYPMLRDILASFHWSVSYFVDEVSPAFLLLAGVAFLLPVAASAGLHSENRFYPRGRKAYAAWGIVLYLLGLILMVQVDQLWHYAH